MTRPRPTERARRPASRPPLTLSTLAMALWVALAPGCTIDVFVDDADGQAPRDGAVGPDCPTTAIVAASCALEDLQAAADAVEASGGGALCVPSGTCTHAGALKLSDGVSLYGAGEGETILVDADLRVEPAFYGDLGLPFRITGFRLEGASRLSVRGADGFRLDHLTMEASGSDTVIAVSESRRGLLDHLTITGAGGEVCIAVSQGYDVTAADWVADVRTLLGSGEAIVVEDSLLQGCGKALHGSGHAQLVFRHNTVRGSEQGDVHLAGPGHGPPCGARLAEIHENLFEDRWGLWSSHSLQGGAALVYRNTFRDYDNGIGLHLDTQAQDFPAEMRPRDVWIWENTFPNLGAGHADACPGDWQAGVAHCNEVWVWDITDHPGLTSAAEIQLDRDYFLRPPTLADDGVDYAPLPYPHPFTTGGLSLP